MKIKLIEHLLTNQFVIESMAWDAIFYYCSNLCAVYLYTILHAFVCY